ncbi:MAG: cysteine desulfurase family protein [Limisphaerales bacterium]
MSRIYFDHQSATPLLPEAQEAMAPFLREHFGSPSSLHQEGFAAREGIKQARERTATLINAEAPDNIIFTSNGAEAINLAIKGTALANQRSGRHIVYSAAEQPAVNASIEWLESIGFTSTKVPVTSDGWIEPAAIEVAIRKDTILVCTHFSNVDIGTIQPLAAISRITVERGIPLFVDAVAAAGWLPIDVQALRIDLLAFSPNRFYGPKGVGILYRHRRARLTSLIHGGDQEEGRRAGTENVPAIVGAGIAAEIAAHDLPARAAHVSGLQRRALMYLNARSAYLRLNGPAPGEHRHPANLNLSVEFVEGEGLALMLDAKGIALAAGAACVTKSMRIPPILAAIGLPESLAKGNILLTFGKDNTENEIDYLIETFAKAVSTLREMSPLWEDFQRGLIKSETGPSRSGAATVTSR